MLARLTPIIAAITIAACADYGLVGVCQDGSCDPRCDSGVDCAANDAGDKTCTNDSQCAGGRCWVAESRCVACLANTDCQFGTCDLEAHECIAVSDSCAGQREPLSLSDGEITLHGSTERASDETRLSCGFVGSTSPDVVFPLAIPNGKRLSVTVTSESGPSFRPVVSLRSSCDSPTTESAYGCAYVGPSSTAAHLVVDSLAAGTYFLWVEGENELTGSFTVQLALADTPPVDRCSAPRALELVSGVAEVFGDTTGLRDDLDSTCGGKGNADAVYAFTLTASQRVKIEATGADGFKPVLSVRTSCESDLSGRGCATADIKGTAVLDLPAVDQGISYVIVDGADGKPGRYRLRVRTMPPLTVPTNDTCASPTVIAVPSNELGTVVLQGDTTLAKSDALSCSGTGGDVVYSLTTTMARQLTVRATPTSGNARPAVYVRKLCDSEKAADLLGCGTANQPSFPAQLTLSKLEPGTWFIWVDGAAGSSGPFELHLELSALPPPPANDTCQSPALISVASGSVSTVGTTVGANDSISSCTLSSAPDVAYSISVPTRQSLAIDVKGVSGSALRPILSFQPAGVCSSTISSVPVACAVPDPQIINEAVLVLPDVMPGDYTLWVDGDVGSRGAFSMRVEMSAPVTAAPANDQCGTFAPSLSPGVATAGDTRGAVSDSYGSCNLAFGANGEFAPDVAYVFTVTTQKTHTLSVVPDPVDGQLLRPVVYVRGPAIGCSALGATKACAAASTYGGSASLQLSNLATGTYTVWVDGAGTSAGRFTVTLQ